MTEKLFKDDELAVAVRADAAEDIKKAYCTLGWQLKDEYGDGSYRDIIHMDFTRPHLIEGKDRLQLLQVRYEVNLNFIARARRRVGARAAVLAALIIIVGLAFLAFGIYNVINAPSVMFIVGGAVLILSGVAFFGIAAYACSVLLQRDRERIGKLIVIFKENIGSILKESAAITGVRLED